MAMKRTLLEDTVRQDPDPDRYEEWLLECCLAAGVDGGSMRAMALEIFHDWELAQTSAVFRSWLRDAAPSEDATP